MPPAAQPYGPCPCPCCLLVFSERPGRSNRGSFCASALVGLLTLCAELRRRYSVIEPRYFAVPGKPADDEHPASHSIYQGELLYKRIYDTLRAGPAWNETALLIIYDEHGGLYDHVASPTTGVPSPTPGLSCIYGGDKYYDFSRLGVRLPAFLISPWVSPGQVIHAPQGPAAPAKTSQYTHSSVSR